MNLRWTASALGRPRIAMAGGWNIADEDLAMAAGGSEITDIFIVTGITFSVTATGSAAAAAASI